MAAFFKLPRLPSSREGGGGEGRVGWATSSIGFGINCWVGLGWVGFGLAAVLVGFPCLVVQYTVQVGTSGLKKMLSVSQPRSPFI
jgi:hypothetical protein